MNSLRQFREPIEVADQPIGANYTAYRMDGAGSERPDMRLEIGLGTCHCCDYFTIQENSVLLIEETHLLKTIEKYQSEYDSMLEGEKKDRFVNRRIRDENTLKVYGSLLVLCRWAARHNEVAESTSGKKHNFWLVVSDAESADDQIALADIQPILFQSLRSALRGNLIGEVEVLTPSQFKRKLRP